MNLHMTISWHSKIVYCSYWVFTIYEDVFGSVPCFINQKRPDSYKNDMEKYVDILFYQANKIEKHM